MLLLDICVCVCVCDDCLCSRVWLSRPVSSERIALRVAETELKAYDRDFVTTCMQEGLSSVSFSQQSRLYCTVAAAHVHFRGGMI